MFLRVAALCDSAIRTADMFEVILGIPLGIVASLLAWWILYHKIVPKIEFSREISKTKTGYIPSGYRYRIKVANTGRRAIVDIELFARLYIRGLGEGYPKNLTVITIPFGENRIPRMAPRRHGGTALVPTLHIWEISEHMKARMPSPIRAKIEERTILLEQLMSLGSECWLRVFLFAYDEFSGAKRVFEAEKYRKGHMKSGKFQQDSLEVIAEDVYQERTCNGLANESTEGRKASAEGRASRARVRAPDPKRTEPKSNRWRKGKEPSSAGN